MDSLIDRINRDLRDSLKSGNKEKTETLRFVSAQIHNREIEKRSRGNLEKLTEEEVLEVLRREVKKRKEAILMFGQSNRQDLVLKEENELVFIEPYLPKMMDREQIEIVVREVMASGKNDFASIMKEVMARVKGQAQGSEVGLVVKQNLDKDN